MKFEKKTFAWMKFEKKNFAKKTFAWMKFEKKIFAWMTFEKKNFARMKFEEKNFAWIKFEKNPLKWNLKRNILPEWNLNFCLVTLAYCVMWDMAPSNAIVHSTKRLEIALAHRAPLPILSYSELSPSFCGRPPPSRSL